MKIEVYDDYRSLIHGFVGFVIPLFPILFPLIIGYEVVEYNLKKGEEPVKNFIGDIYEFGFGALIGSVFFRMIGIL